MIYFPIQNSISRGNRGPYINESLIQLRKFRGGFGIFFLKNSSLLKKILKKGRGFNPQNPSLNTPLALILTNIKII